MFVFVFVDIIASHVLVLNYIRIGIPADIITRTPAIRLAPTYIIVRTPATNTCLLIIIYVLLVSSGTSSCNIIASIRTLVLVRNSVTSWYLTTYTEIGSCSPLIKIVTRTVLHVRVGTYGNHRTYSSRAPARVVLTEIVGDNEKYVGCSMCRRHPRHVNGRAGAGVRAPGAGLVGRENREERPPRS